MNKNTVWDLTLKSFNAQAASSAPTPGGGSVATVAASFGLSLILMAIEITKKTSTDEKLSEKQKPLIDASVRLSKYADKDIEVFDQYMAALKMPKNSEQEKEQRKLTMGSALINATTTPIEAAKIICTALELALEITPAIKKEVVSDIGAGVHLLEGASNAILLNVAINLPYIKDENLKNKFNLEKELVISEIKKYSSSCLALVHDKLK